MAKIKIDCSDSSVVLVCESCSGTWRAFAWTREDAYKRAIAHEQNVHPGEESTRAAYDEWQARRRRRELATRR